MLTPGKKLDKVIITNLSALTLKYGRNGVGKIQRAVTKLINADKNRGLMTILCPLDVPAVMQQLGEETAPVTMPTDPKQNKDAIDTIYHSFAPDYLLLLGGVDIIPHQDLKNLAHHPRDRDGDADKIAFGDLPYACEAPYSKDPQKFLGPTRVVGRLPDITNTADPQYLIKLLDIASEYVETDSAPYISYFGISVPDWKTSTALNLSAIFGNSDDLKTVPPNSSHWPSQLLTRLSHFINCHGGLNCSRFFGEGHNPLTYPVGLDAADLNNRISNETIVAAECCYGAQLFDPALNQVDPGQMGMANTYLANGAYGFLGSTTIAYGYAHSNGLADLICRYFFQSLLTGASLGRAALEARQTFISEATIDDPWDLKTISQFNLYADPSLTPIKTYQAIERGSISLRRWERAERRRKLFSRGLALAKSQPTIRKDIIEKKDPILAALHKAAIEQGLSPKKILTFKVKAPFVSASMPAGLFSKGVFPNRVHLVFCKPQEMKKAELVKKKVPPVVRIVALLARELDGTIISVQKIVSR